MKPKKLNRISAWLARKGKHPFIKFKSEQGYFRKVEVESPNYTYPRYGIKLTGTFEWKKTWRKDRTADSSYSFRGQKNVTKSRPGPHSGLEISKNYDKTGTLIEKRKNRVNDGLSREHKTKTYKKKLKKT